MNYQKIRTATLYCGITAGLATACAGPPQLNPALEQARVDYATVRSDTLVVNKAPVALKKAEEALALSEQLWRKKADKELLEHQIYLTQQRVRIAHGTARLKDAEETIAGAGLERQAVQLEARNQEVKAATMEAEKAKSQTKIAQQSTQDAQARVEKLVKELGELEAKQTERGLVLTLKDVLFGVGQSQLKPGTQHIVDQIADFLVEYPVRNVLIEGHTDSDGSAASNEDLSLRRAEAVRQALMSKGIGRERIRILGYGETYPMATNASAEGRQENRRVEVVFSDDQGTIIER